MSTCVFIFAMVSALRGVLIFKTGTEAISLMEGFSILLAETIFVILIRIEFVLLFLGGKSPNWPL